jgi:hypothetical protein
VSPTSKSAGQTAVVPAAGLETRDTADLEVRATLVAAWPRSRASTVQSVGIIVRCEDFSIPPMNLACQETCNLLMQVHQKVVFKKEKGFFAALPRCVSAVNSYKKRIALAAGRRIIAINLTVIGEAVCRTET